MIGIAVAASRPRGRARAGPSPATARLRTLQGRAPRLPLHRPTVPSTRAGVAVAAISGAAAIGAWAWLGYSVTVPVLPAIAGAVAGATAATALRSGGG